MSQHRAADDSGEVCELLAAVAADQPGGGAAHLRPHGVPGPHVHTQGAGRHGHTGKCLTGSKKRRPFRYTKFISFFMDPGADRGFRIGSLSTPPPYFSFFVCALFKLCSGSNLAASYCTNEVFWPQRTLNW